jgi:uncharacterized cupin superfamily protein
MGAKESVQVPITRIGDAELVSWPLPAEWVEQGSPQASGAVLSKSDDSRIVRGVWACTPGRFRWMYSYDETIVVVQGRATVLMDSGVEVSLSPGVMAFFARGQGSTWTIHENLRKAFHADSPDPLPF